MEGKFVAIGLVVFALIFSLALFVSFDSVNKRIDSLNKMQYETATQIASLTERLNESGLIGPEPSPEPQPSYQPVDPGIFNLTGKTPRGSPNASVMIVDFSDVGCPFSGKTRDVLKQLVIDYPNKIVLYFKYFPGHESAFKAHEGMECAKDQGKFWEYHDIVFAHQANLTRPELISYAKQIGLNEAQFTQCLDSNVTQERIATDYNEAVGFGVDGTPFFFINGKPLVGFGEYKYYTQAVDAALAAKK